MASVDSAPPTVGVRLPQGLTILGPLQFPFGTLTGIQIRRRRLVAPRLIFPPVSLSLDCLLKCRIARVSPVVYMPADGVAGEMLGCSIDTEANGDANASTNECTRRGRPQADARPLSCGNR